MFLRRASIGDGVLAYAHPKTDSYASARRDVDPQAVEHCDAVKEPTSLAGRETVRGNG